MLFSGGSYMKIKPIGFVRNEVLHPYNSEWGEEISEIIIKDEFAKGLIGLEEFTHAIIIFYMHQASYIEERHLVRHPQNREELLKIGIFAESTTPSKSNWHNCSPNNWSRGEYSNSKRSRCNK